MEFKTAAEENAGTDANVYFQMMGEEGKSQEIELKNKGKGYFNRGQLDRFRIRTEDVGRVSEHAGGEVLPYTGYIVCAVLKGAVVLAVLVTNGVSILATLVLNRVWFLHSSLEFGGFF